MRIIHCADLHLDSKMESNLSKEKARERKNEMLLTFKSMVEYASNNDVSVIIIAGDLFDSKNISAKTRNMVIDVINYYSNIDFLYLRGNHDMISFIDDLDNIPKNLKLFNDCWTSYEYDGVTITGVELNKDNSNIIYNSLILDSSQVNIVVMHGQTSKYFSKDVTEIVNISKLKYKHIDYLALGHIHSYSIDELDHRGKYCYSGCLEGRGFDECGDKGFVLIDINNNMIETSFVKAAKRTLHSIHADVTGLNTTSEAEKFIDKLIEDISPDDMVKITIYGDILVDTEIDIDFLVNKYASKFYYIKIYNKTKLSISYEEYENDISLKGEFIRMVLESDRTKEEKDKIILYGLKALSGEELD